MVYRLDPKYIKQSPVRSNYMRLCTIRNIWFIIHKMDYGDEFYYEDEYIPYVKVTHKANRPISPRTNDQQLDKIATAIYTFERSGQEYIIAFESLNEISMYKNISEDKVQPVDLPEFIEYKPQNTIKRYQNI